VTQTPTYTRTHHLAGTKTLPTTIAGKHVQCNVNCGVTFTLDSHLTSVSPLTYPALALSAGQVTTLTVVATGRYLHHDIGT